MNDSWSQPLSVSAKYEIFLMNLFYKAQFHCQFMESLISLFKEISEPPFKTTSSFYIYYTLPELKSLKEI